MIMQTQSTKKESFDSSKMDAVGEGGAADSDALNWNTMSLGQKCAYFTRNVTVEPIIAFYIMPSVLASLATQNLNLDKSCRVNLGYPDHVCTAISKQNASSFRDEEVAVQQLVAGMLTWKTALQSALPAILILFIGAWSDRTGLRKPCMLFPILGEFLTSISLIICTYWFYELPMEAAGVSEALWPALTGGWFTMFMGAFSYVTDITTPESRMLRIGAVNLFAHIGIPVGMALSGILYVKLGFYGVFTISTVCYTFCFLYCFLRIKEVPRTLTSKQKEEVKLSGCGSFLDIFSIRHVAETFKVAFKSGANNRRMRIIVLMIIHMAVIGPTHGEMAVSYLFQRYRFKWNEVQCSMFSTYSMVTNLAGMMLAVGVFTHLLKLDDSLVGVISCMSKVLASFVYAFATTDWMMYLAPLVECMNGTSYIAMRSIASKLVSNNELGKINSLFGVCEALMPLVYGPMYSAVYRSTMETFPGAFFFLGGGLTVPAVLLFVWLYTEHRGDIARKAVEEADRRTLELNVKSATSNVHRGLDNAAFEAERVA